jgi:hypothetical protein
MLSGMAMLNKKIDNLMLLYSKKMFDPGCQNPPNSAKIGNLPIATLEDLHALDSGLFDEEKKSEFVSTKTKDLCKKKLYRIEL